SAGARRRCCFFSSRRRHTRSKRDWSSDVCSSDLFCEDEKDEDGYEGDDAEGGGEGPESGVVVVETGDVGEDDEADGEDERSESDGQKCIVEGIERGERWSEGAESAERVIHVLLALGRLSCRCAGRRRTGRRYAGRTVWGGTSRGAGSVSTRRQI